MAPPVKRDEPLLRDEPRLRDEPVERGAHVEPTPRSPWRWVPPVYVQQGTQYGVVDTVTSTFLTVMGTPLASIGHLGSWITVPWQAKALWSPLVDVFGTRRAWILGAQLAVLGALVFLAWAVGTESWLALTLTACLAVGCAAATHDIAADGFYLRALDERGQAAFSGVRNSCFRVGLLIAGGAIVWLAGTLRENGHTLVEAWRLALLAGAGVYALLFVVSAFALPRPASDVPIARARDGGAPNIARAFHAYVTQPRFVAVAAFIFCFRLGESMLTRMIRPFLLRGADEGGLGFTEKQVGLAYGTAGIVLLLAGGLLGGALLARHGLRRWLWPMAIAMHLPNLGFWWAAVHRPAHETVYVLVALEQFAYGFGFSAYMVFLMQISRRSAWSTTHYAISTGLMGVAQLVAGYWTGDLVNALGFAGFFALVCAAAVPGLAVLPFAPLAERERGEAPA